MREWSLKAKDSTYNPPKVAIFSTELSIEDYVYRHVLMRAGLYEKGLSNNIKKAGDRILKALDDYRDERNANPTSLQIFGNVIRFEQVGKFLKDCEEKKRPNIVFVDYIQELSIADKYDEKETMPMLASKFKELAGKYGVAIVLVSQMNIYAVGRDYDSDQAQSPGYSYGKQLNSTAHTSIVLRREKVDGKLSSELIIQVMKARNGTLGNAKRIILPGYQLRNDK